MIWACRRKCKQFSCSVCQPIKCACTDDPYYFTIFRLDEWIRLDILKAVHFKPFPGLDWTGGKWFDLVCLLIWPDTHLKIDLTQETQTPKALEDPGPIFDISEGHTQLSPILCSQPGSDVSDHGHPGQPCEELRLSAQVPPGGRQRCGKRRDSGQPSRWICWVSICLQQWWVNQHIPHIFFTQNVSNTSFCQNGLRSRLSLTVSLSENSCINRFSK